MVNVRLVQLVVNDVLLEDGLGRESRIVRTSSRHLSVSDLFICHPRLGGMSRFHLERRVCVWEESFIVDWLIIWIGDYSRVKCWDWGYGLQCYTGLCELTDTGVAFLPFLLWSNLF